jgi:hypothetical protein
MIKAFNKARTFTFLGRILQFYDRRCREEGLATLWEMS